MSDYNFEYTNESGAVLRCKVSKKILYTKSVDYVWVEDEKCGVKKLQKSELRNITPPCSSCLFWKSSCKIGLVEMWHCSDNDYIYFKSKD